MGTSVGDGLRESSRGPRVAEVGSASVMDPLRTLAGLNVLLAADFTVLARCAGAHEALRCVRIYEPDVLIIDQDMPAMDGVDVLKQLRAAGDQTPVVLLATAGNATLMEALAFKVEGILFKQSSRSISSAECASFTPGGNGSTRSSMKALRSLPVATRSTH